MSFSYIVYGLVAKIPFACPLLTVAPEGAETDIEIVDGNVPYNLVNPTAHGNNWDATSDSILIRCGIKSGRFLVSHGNTITFQRSELVEQDRLFVSLFASALPLLLQQRGMLVLHANTALTDNGAVAVCGESGSGKTTTVAGILASGHKLLADDITVLRDMPNGMVEVIPGPPQLHLCEDTADQFGFDIIGVPRFQWRRMKAALPVPEKMSTEPAALKAIYYMKIGDGEAVTSRQLIGVEKFDILQDCIYGPFPPESNKSVFQLLSLMVSQVDVHLIERPAYSWTLDQVIEVILND